ncbi:HTH_Tnp_Tc3_2 domain-containing protein [Trichonephila clavipes]|nr:HTH_Tnp_Tc3_2 domain-containing protein [Trichonephila clavipes]
MEVFEQLRSAQNIISRLWQGFQEDGNVSKRYIIGFPRFSTSNDDQYLVVTSKRSRRSISSYLSRQLSAAMGKTVARQKVYRRLGHVCLQPCQMSSIHGNSMSPTVSLEYRICSVCVVSVTVRCFPASPGLVCSLILVGHSKGEHQVSVATKTTSLNGTISVMWDCR